MGLRFHFVENGVFESGAGNANPIEAKKELLPPFLSMYSKILEMSLGVATFSVSQRKAIRG